MRTLFLGHGSLAGLLAVTLASTAFAETVASNTDTAVRLNEIQVIGTHNSYHAGLPPAIARLLERQDPKTARALDYRHPDLQTQLSNGVRQLELDIFADSLGGRYASPKGPEWAVRAGITGEKSPPPDDRMTASGFKVMHTQDLDYVSNCQPFLSCLKTIRDWSKSHPRHLPLFLLIETKQGQPDGHFDFTEEERFTPETLDALDSEIRSVFHPDDMITPDRVRQNRASLEEAVLAKQWPTIEQARGKVIFLMDQKNVGPTYLQGHPSLRGRILFTNAEPHQPDAAFIERNDGTPEEIAALVRQGYLVRTRADEDTEQGRSNDGRRRDAALASGAQIISTDYPPGEPAEWSGYRVAFPNNVPARCNPVAKSKACRESRLETTDDDAGKD